MIFLHVFWGSIIITRAWGNYPGFAVDYFSTRAVAAVTSTLCARETNVRLWKEFSEKRIEFSYLDLTVSNESDAVDRLRSRYFRLGVLVDLKCPGSSRLIQTANENRLFVSAFSLNLWLVIASENVSLETLRASAKAHATEMSDPMEFLTQRYDDPKNEELLLKINKQVNADFIETFRRRETKAKPKTETNRTEADVLFGIDVLLHDELAVAVGGNGNRFDLLTVFKPAVESEAKVTKMGEVTSDGKLEMKEDKRKRMDLGDALLRAGSAVLEPRAFTRIDDVTTRERDVWLKMSYPHVRLLAEDLNFRIIIRFFDDYGWQTNGTFGHLMGLLQKKNADLSVAGLLMRADRFAIVDFLVCPFRLQTGILFREPSLSSVSNIFLLPFSRAIWLSIAGVIVLTVVALRCRGLAGKKLLPPDEDVASLLDIGDYVVGAVCQQGFASTPKSLSARVSILILLLTSLALFTSYSASIVALLQSSSSAITTISDITRSDLEVGIQMNFPYYKVLMREATHPVLKEFYKRKVLAKGERAFVDRRCGIEKMRTGMFAFEVELTAGYKLISETYEEREKCGITEIDPIPKPFICVAVLKHSPYKEIFTQRLKWQQEVGLFERSWKMWADQKPKCEVGRIGFISVGLTEFRPALQEFAFGIVAALVLLIGEFLYKNHAALLRLPRGRTSRMNAWRKYPNKTLYYASEIQNAPGASELKSLSLPRPYFYMHKYTRSVARSKGWT